MSSPVGNTCDPTQCVSAEILSVGERVLRVAEIRWIGSARGQFIDHINA